MISMHFVLLNLKKKLIWSNRFVNIACLTLACFEGTSIFALNIFSISGFLEYRITKTWRLK